MKIYVSEEERFKDVKSAGYSFTAMSVIGYLLLILLWLDMLPVNIDITNKIMTTVVMGILFTVFLIVGIKSFLSLNSIESMALKQQNNENDIVKWFLDNYYEHFKLLNPMTSSEEKYFEFYDEISGILFENYPELKEEENDHITEIIISKLDENNDEN